MTAKSRHNYVLSTGKNYSTTTTVKQIYPEMSVYVAFSLHDFTLPRAQL